MACQLEYGWNYGDFIGTFKSPANTALEAGTFVTLSGDEIQVSAGVKVDDGDYVLTQKVTVDGPSYQEIIRKVVQHEVRAGSPVTIAPTRKGNILRTDVIATGAELGAIDENTAIGTALSIANGKLRVAQADDVQKAILRTALNANGEILAQLV